MKTFATIGDCLEIIYRKNYRHGTKTCVWANGDKYVGKWSVGIVLHANFGLHGDDAWRCNILRVKTFNCGDKYEGFYVNDELEGSVKYEWAGSDSYEGTWKLNKMHGEVVCVLPQEELYMIRGMKVDSLSKVCIDLDVAVLIVENIRRENGVADIRVGRSF
ncbi:hypothetical protein PsorP6_004302 [Peronosclerospora sorghi]|uniref:Uncharacterized protein n=1 Tax=Peronosclerospora sorghi TaxID=230839 RepID=A0ACC0VME2_9STRA|nr:hypothetical protein PsorP6_004302 [Peronosclerospora sorghi]